jgi:hypothetical protein
MDGLEITASPLVSSVAGHEQREPARERRKRPPRIGPRQEADAHAPESGRQHESDSQHAVDNTA